MDQDLLTLTADCPAIRFRRRYADVVALSRGEASVLRPVLDETTRRGLAAVPPPDRAEALVLGGNGFVGAHLVFRLCREPGVRRVWVSVRSTPRRGPERRLADTLGRYRLPPPDPAKITFVDADPSLPLFGMPPDAYGALAERVDLVFNCASSSDYSMSYLDLRADYVAGLLRVLQFCIDARRKHLTYMGSISSYFYQEPADFRRPDSWWYSGYAQMKWVNGQILGWLARDGALPVTLCESPYVLGATDVGRDPGLHYGWWRVVGMARSIGLIWDGPGMNYVPVDVLVDVLTENALRSDPLPRVLPRNPVAYDNRMLADLLGLDVVPWERFAQEAARRIPLRRIGADLSSNIDQLIRVVNRPRAVFPAGHDPSWCDNRRLFALYLSHVPFRGSTGQRAGTPGAALVAQSS